MTPSSAILPNLGGWLINKKVSSIRLQLDSAVYKQLACSGAKHEVRERVAKEENKLHNLGFLIP
jgi:hypothetical protein